MATSSSSSSSNNNITTREEDGEGGGGGTSGGAAGGEYVSIPLGGPIYVSDMVGPLTTVSQFESSIFHQLQGLKDDICWDSVDTCNHDLSVGELKILTEEELVNKAFEVSFKEGVITGSSSQLSEDANRKTNDGLISDIEIHCPESSVLERDLVTSDNSVRGSTLKAADNGKVNAGSLKKRKRVPRRSGKNKSIDESYLVEVEKLARIKQKQEEDKAAARLHSFNGSCGPIVCATASLEKKEVMSSFKSIGSSAKVRSSSTCEFKAVVYPEILLCIEVYHNRRAWSKAQEFLVLGRQYLTELKDKISCLTDEMMEKSGQDNASGYFLIEDVFCNDLREASAIDYSKPILDWLRESEEDAIEKWECIISGELQQKQKELLGNGNGPKLPHFKSVPMHKTRFCDLKFRLGAGYLYCHQGDCKHIIVIRDMRLIHPEDVQNQAAYPVVLYQSKMRFQKCSVCKIYKAEKMTVDDKWAPENPCYFCRNCYYLLHYVDSSLLYENFSVHEYLHE